MLSFHVQVYVVYFICVGCRFGRLGFVLGIGCLCL